ncbi:MAG: cobalt-precorrin-4/precorrin-4 C(11)-methyltransferase [Eubacterium sp.]|nr:cobalt-precorrin-4/precorrin-4 C(11)-methyltransferase [Eubacterium sp.]
MVHFVGAGPGATDLITVRGMELLKKADLVIYAGSLVNPALLDYCRKDIKIYDSSRLTLDEVIAIIRDFEAGASGENGEEVTGSGENGEEVTGSGTKGEEVIGRKGEKVIGTGDGVNIVRLHTGDPCVYGAIREQMEELEKIGIEYDVTPGVTAAFGAAASLGIEYTLPGISQSLIITREEGKTAVPDKETIRSFAKHNCSMAIYLSTGLIEKLTENLLAGGFSKDTPAAIVYKATWEDEKRAVTTVAGLKETVDSMGINKTAVILVGNAINPVGNVERSKLYSPDFSTEFRASK